MIGQTASTSAEFSLEDLPSTSGRLDVLLRCVRAALLTSHGLRPNVQVYLVLRGGGFAARVLRVHSGSARFIRPDERSLALLVKKTLAACPEPPAGGFVEVRPGVALAGGDLECVLADLGEVAAYLLEEKAPDLRDTALATGNVAFFLGDHLGLNDSTRAELAARNATPVSVGPLSLHSDDVIAITSNELDRRGIG